MPPHVARQIVSVARGQACISENEIYSNARSGIHLRGGACPVVEKNLMRHGEAAGLLVSEGASGWIRQNELRGHSKTELQVCGRGSHPSLCWRRCAAGAATPPCAGAGVRQGQPPLPVLAQVCDKGSHPLVEGNTMCQSRAGGILVCARAGGWIRRNTIHSNASAGARLAEGSCARFEANTLRDGRDCGLVLCGGCSSSVVDNEVGEHSKAGVLAYGESTVPILLRNCVHSSMQAGVYMYGGCSPVLESNEIKLNVGAGVLVSERSDPILRHNAIHSGDDAGVLYHQEGKGSLLDNNIYNSKGRATTTNCPCRACGGGAHARVTLCPADSPLPRCWQIERTGWRCCRVATRRSIRTGCMVGGRAACSSTRAGRWDPARVPHGIQSASLMGSSPRPSWDPARVPHLALTPLPP